MQRGIRCMLMRGGTSKGAYFLASDFPSLPSECGHLLLCIMGSPDARQIDGLGGAHPLTSKVAVVEKSTATDADIDFLFAQVSIDKHGPMKPYMRPIYPAHKSPAMRSTRFRIKEVQ